MKKIILWSLATLLFVLIAAFIGIKLRFGGGAPYPDISTAPVLPEEALSVLVELDRPPGNVASSADGRIFFNTHPISEPAAFNEPQLFELIDGEPIPYPNEAFQQSFNGVFGMTIDRQHRLWLIEPAGLDDRPTRLLAFDLSNDQLIFEHAFEDGMATVAQDLRVSPDGNTIYLADTGLFTFTPGAIIVFDVVSGSARKVLEGHPSTLPQDWVIQAQGGPYRLAGGLITFQVGVDGIALSHDGHWLYYATMSHDTLFRVPAGALRDASLTDPQISDRIEVVGRKPLSDGIAIDEDGTLYITDIEHGGLARMDTTGQIETLVRSPEVVWADGVVMANDSTLYFTDSAIPSYITPLLTPPSRNRIAEHIPYRIYRVRL